MSKILNKSNVTCTYELPDSSTKTVTIESNESMTEYMTTSFKKEKSADKEFAQPSDEVKVTLKLTNESDYDISNVSIKDILNNEATFNTGTVTINGTLYDQYNPVTGFELTDDITKNGGTTTIEYTVTVVENPTTDILNAVSQVTYTVAERDNLVENSNTVSVQLVEEDVTITKTSDKSAVISGETLKFQNVVRNIGNTTNTDITFKDPIPEGTTFIENSVEIDGVKQEGYDPAVGFKLNDLAPNAEITVTFEVKVN